MSIKFNCKNCQNWTCVMQSCEIAKSNFTSKDCKKCKWYGRALYCIKYDGITIPTPKTIDILCEYYNENEKKGEEKPP